MLAKELGRAPIRLMQSLQGMFATEAEDYFVQEVPRRIRSHNLQSLCMVASAYARLRRGDEALFEPRPTSRSGILYTCKVQETMLREYASCPAMHNIDTI